MGSISPGCLSLGQVFRMTQLQPEAKPKGPALTAGAYSVTPSGGMDIPRKVNTHPQAGSGVTELTVKGRVFGPLLCFVGVPEL